MDLLNKNSSLLSIYYFFYFSSEILTNQHFLIQFNHTIKKRSNTTHLIFYFLCLRRYSTSRDMLIKNSVLFSKLKKKKNIRNSNKIPIFYFSPIIRLKQDPERHICYFIFSVLDDIQLEGIC